MRTGPAPLGAGFVGAREARIDMRFDGAFRACPISRYSGRGPEREDRGISAFKQDQWTSGAWTAKRLGLEPTLHDPWRPKKKKSRKRRRATQPK
jgi:hypothetical protein